MKICQVGTGYDSIPPKGSAAVETVIYNLSKELRREKNQIHIIDIKAKRKKEKTFFCHEIKLPFFLKKRTSPRTLRHIIKRIWFALKATFRLLSLAKKEKFDIIHVHNKYAGFLILALRPFHKTPVVYTVHSPIWVWPKEKLPKLFRLLTFLEKRCLIKADKVIAVSKTLKRNIIQKAHVAPSRIKVIPNGVDTTQFNPAIDSRKLRKKLAPKNQKVIICIGRVSPEKNQKAIAEAIPHVIKKFNNVKFVFVGPLENKQYSAEIQKIIKKHKIEKFVVFIGMVPDKELKKYYTVGDIFVLPSEVEGLSLVLLEAMSSGNAIIASPIPSTKEIKGNAVVYANPANTKEFAFKIVKLLKNNKTRNKLKKIARKTVINYYSWKKVAQETLRFYKEVCSL